MWSNYILTSLRTLQRNKLFVGINLVSIALAFSLCTIAYFNVQYNRDFNKAFDRASQLYKVNSQKITADGNRTQSTSPLPLAQVMNSDIAGIKAARFHRISKLIRLNDNLYRESIGFVDPEFFELFNFPLVDGNDAAFNDRSQVFMTEEVAAKYFGDEPAIGNQINLVLTDGKTLPLTVAGVLKDLPQNTSFFYDLILPFELYLDLNKIEENDWSQWIDGTFFYAEQANENDVTEAIDRYVSAQNEVNKGQEIAGYHVDSILDWPEYENNILNSNFNAHLHPASVLGTLSSAIAVLLLASFNFINSSIAISRKRLKEIGMRKVLGGRKRDLRIQFLVESLFQIFIAMALSGPITALMADAYNQMFQFEIVEFSRVSLLPFLLFMGFVWLLTGFLAGMYPAFYISKFESVTIFRSAVKFSRKNWLTKALLTFQLMVCIYNVFSLILFVQNAEYQEHLDRGYEVHKSINIPLSSSDQFATIEPALSQMPGVTGVTGTVDPIGFKSTDITIGHLGENYEVASLHVGEGYLQSLNVRLTAGDFFRANQENNGNYVIINEMLANSLSEEVLNQWILQGEDRFQVIGIVEDFNLKPIMLNNKIQPTVLFFSPEESYQYANVALAANNMDEMNATLEQEWNKLFPDELYLGFIQEDVMKAVRQTNEIMLNINGFVAIVTLVISALGLYAMVYLNIQTRIKEFGVRKVLGAPVRSILYLINKEVVIMLLIASGLGLVAGSVVISSIMDIVYAYHKDIELNNYIWPILIVLVIVALAIGYRTFRSALENPVNQLRTE